MNRREARAILKRAAKARAACTYEQRRVFAITRNNSTVLGADCRGQSWGRWWREARWSKALPCKGGIAPLNVPCGGKDADDAVYRVRPKLKRCAFDVGQVRVECVRGRWCWVYPDVKRGGQR